MKRIETMYFHLFNAVTDALEAMEKTNYGTAKDILKAAQQQTEEAYIGSDESSGQ